MHRKLHVAGLHPKDQGSGGGAWLGTFRLFKGLNQFYKSEFLDITLFTPVKNTDEYFVRRIFFRGFGSFAYYANAFIEQICQSFILNRDAQGKFSFNVSSIFNFHRASILKSPFLYLHWAGNNFISIFKLQQIPLAHKKVVIKFADYWWITGGCHYPKQCTGYLHDECRNCPYVKSFFKWIPATSWRLKHAMLSEVNVALVAPSASLYRAISYFSYLYHKTHQISNGIDSPSSYDFQSSIKQPVVGVVCHGFSDIRKNPLLVCNVIKFLAQSRRRVHICGDSADDLYSNLSRFERSYVVNYSMIRDQKEMQSFYSSCSHLVFLSTEDNAPNQLMEAMSHGLVVLAFDVGFVNEHIQQGVNGYLFPMSAHHNSGMIFRILNDHLEQMEEYHLVSRNAYSYAKEKFSLEAMSSKYMSLFLS